jgi:hypothetical protein
MGGGRWIQFLAERANAFGGLIQCGQCFAHGGSGLRIVQTQELKLDSCRGKHGAGLIVQGAAGFLKLTASFVQIASEEICFGFARGRHAD